MGKEIILDGYDLDGNPLNGDEPGGLVPGMIAHNGAIPETSEAYEALSKVLNNGHPPEVASKGPRIIRILVSNGVMWKDGTAWKILVGSGAAIGTAVGIIEVTKKLLESRKKTNR